MKRHINQNDLASLKPQPNAANDNSSEGHASLPKELQSFGQLPNCAHVRQPVVLGLFGISAATLWRRVNQQLLPAPRKFGGRISAWNVGELREVLKG